MTTTDSTGPLSVNVLGTIELVVDGVGVTFTSPRLRQLLGILVANSNNVVSTDRLVDVIWPDDDERLALRTLRTNVWRLRNLMGPTAGETLLTRPGGYVLSVAAEVVDADRFEALAEAATALLGSGDALTAVGLFDAALALWRGEPFEGYASEEWARPTAVRLTSIRAAVCERRIEALLAAGRTDEAIADLAEMIAHDPFRERVQALYMRALYRNQRQAEALRAYAEYRSVLGEELGVEPSSELRQLESSMLRHDLSAVSSMRVGIARGYELSEAVAATPVTVTYRARAPRTSIDVMLTVVDRSISCDVAYVKEFEVGSQRMQAIVHPHLVSVTDCWRDADGAYFVSPADRWADQPAGAALGTEGFARLAEQVCGAVHHLHVNGLHHGRLGTEAIHVDTDGNAAVSPGGLATGLRKASVDVDQRDLATWLGSIAPLDLDAAARAVIVRAGAVRADEQYDTVADLCDALIGSTTGRTLGEASAFRNPYVGLRSFHEPDADVFFGRTRLVKQILNRLDEAGTTGRFIAVVGASGSGKSSLVHAGVLPALREGGVEGSVEWFVARMTPGDQPFASCRSALDAVAIRPSDGAGDKPSADLLHRWVHELLPPGATLLLIVDQFEELFAGSIASSERRDFLDMLCAAITHLAGAVRVVVAMRADFYDRPLHHAQFGQLFHECQVVVTTLPDDEVAEAITGPAEVVGLEFESGLVRALVRDFDVNPSLPLLQHALAEMCDRREGTRATLVAYDSIGGLAGGIANRAEALFAEFPSGERPLVRRLLTRLVALGDGTADTRRRVKRCDLDGRADSAAAVDSVLERFGAARLVTFDHDRESREPTVEIAHDALITEWGRLAAWIDEDRDDLVRARLLAGAARSWNEGGRDESELYRGARLDAAISWSERHADELGSDESEFLAASRALAEREADEQAARAEHRRRQHRRLAGLAVVATVAALLAVVAGGVATIQSRRADNQRTEAQAAEATAIEQAGRADDARVAADDARTAADTARGRSDVDRLVAQAIADADDAPARSMLLAAAAYDLSPSTVTAGAMQSTIVAQPSGFAGFIPTDGEISQVEAGTAVIARHTTDSVEIIDRVDHDVRLVIADPTDNTRFALSLDDRWVALAGPTVRVFETTNGSLLAELRRPSRAVTVDFDAAEPSRLAIGFEDGSAEVVRWASGEVESRVPQQGDQIGVIAFSPNGKYLVTATGARESALRIWDSATGASITGNLGVPGTALYHADLAFNRSGTVLASVDRGGVGRVWSFPSGEPLTRTEVTYGVEALNSLEFVDDTVIVASGPSGVLRRWSATDGREIESIEPHAGLVTSIAIDPSGGLLVVGGNEHLSLFDLAGTTPGHSIEPFPPDMRASIATGAAVAASISTDGRTVAAVTPSGVWLWDRRLGDGGARLVPSVSSSGIVFNATLSPDGSLLVVAHLDFARSRTEIVVIDAASLTVTNRIDAPRGAIVAVSPDNRWLAYSSISYPRTPTLDIQDLTTGRSSSLIGDLDTITDDVDPLRGSWVSSLSFSADSQRFAAANHRGAAMIWELATMELVGDPLARGGGAVLDLEFGPADDVIVTVSSSGTISTVDVDSRAPAAPSMSGRSGLTVGLATSPDGKLLLSGGSDGISLWNRSTGLAVGRPYPVPTPLAPPMHWLEDGASFAVVTNRGIETWTVDPLEWRSSLCELAGRSLTDEEWQRFGTAGPTPAC